MRFRVALLVPLLAATALAAGPADGQPAPEGGGGGDCPQGSNVVLTTESDPDLANPVGIDVDVAGNVWVTDSTTNTVFRFTRAGDQTLAIPAGAATPGLQNPVDVVADDTGHVWVADDTNNRIHRFTTAGVQDLTIPPANGQPDLANPESVALNAAGTRLWVLDDITRTLQRFDTTTGAHTLTIPLDNADPDMDGPRGLAVDAAGNLAVTDLGLTHSVYRFDPTGEQTLVVEPDAGDPELETPIGADYDAAGNLVVLDASTKSIQRFGPDGSLQFVVDGVTNGGLGTGRDVTVGQQGDFWATDTANDTVMRWCFRVDAKIRLGTGSFAGDTTVNATGAGQSRSATLADGATSSFTLRLDGESNAQHRIRVRGTAGNGAFRVRYFSGTQNVTASVTGAGFVTPGLVPGFTRDLRVEVHANPGGHATRTLTIRSSSEAAPARVDVVKAVLTRS